MIPEIAYSDIERVYGAPIENGDLARLKKVRLPFPMFLSWNKDSVITSTYVNAVIAQPFVDALSDILSIYGLSFIQENGLNEFGGCHNYREVASGGRLSVHAWGLAVDYCPSLGPLGVPPMTPYFVVKAFEKAGFRWGGWFGRRDGMHFTGINEWK